MAILYQKQEGKDRVMSYASQSLSKSKARYPIYKLEFVALGGLLMNAFMSTFMVIHLRYSQITTHLYMN